MSATNQHEDYEDLCGGGMPAEYRFKTTVNKNGKLETRKYVLFEASAGHKVLFTQEMMKQGVMQTGEKHREVQPGAAEMDIYLLSLCTKRVMEDGSEVPVTKEELRGWRIDALNKVAKRLAAISPGLMNKQESEEEVKKEIEELQSKLKDMDKRKEDGKDDPLTEQVKN